MHQKSNLKIKNKSKIHLKTTRTMLKIAISKQQITKILDIKKIKVKINKMLKALMIKNSHQKDNKQTRKIMMIKLMPTLLHLLNLLNHKPLKTEKYNKESQIYSKEAKLPKITNLFNPLSIASKS